MYIQQAPRLELHFANIEGVWSRQTPLTTMDEERLLQQMPTMQVMANSTRNSKAHESVGATLVSIAHSEAVAV